VFAFIEKKDSKEEKREIAFALRKRLASA